MEKSLNVHYDSTNLKLVMPKGHIQTFSGKLINLFNVNSKDIELIDIAHGLANTCRWNGHTKSFYSVAEHSIRVFDRVSSSKKLTALFHDCEESLWGDIVSPLKALLPTEIITKIVETRQIIFNKFGVPDICDEVNAADIAEMYWDYENQMQNFRHVGLHPIKAQAMWLQKVKLLLK